MENKKRNSIQLVFKIKKGQHQIIIEDTKYYVDEIYPYRGKSSESASKEPLTVWDLHVGAKIDIFGKPTILKKSCRHTNEFNNYYGAFLKEIKNTLLDEIQKYQRKPMQPWIMKESSQGTQQGSMNLRLLIKQVVGLK